MIQAPETGQKKAFHKGEVRSFYLNCSANSSNCLCPFGKLGSISSPGETEICSCRGTACLLLTRECCGDCTHEPSKRHTMGNCCTRKARHWHGWVETCWSN